MNTLADTKEEVTTSVPERVSKERKELKERISKLEKFLGNPDRNKISDEHIYLLKLQMNTMETYSGILKRRLVLLSRQVTSTAEQ